MRVEPGKNLLHYRLVEKIGEGGMGVVWKAIDTTLDRAVAIKILPDSTDFADRLARFDREAKLLASLSHPNIASVFGLHESDGQRFIAMELVPGEDLTARLQSGPLAVVEALGIARQIAAALAAAHDNGVIHRDLKPANVRITPDGQVKVLDFGLAKAFEPGSTSGSVNPSLSPTLTSAGTRAGVILGTAAYMSPEQARGRAVDRRTDVWAFGCVLYEMLTGRPTFGGDTVTDVLASILKTEPDLGKLSGRIPPRVARLLRHCLEKDVAKRPRDAGDIGLEIDEILAGGIHADAPGPEAGRSRGGSWVRTALVAAAALALGLALARLFGLGGAPPARGGPRRLAVTAGENRPIGDARIASDGSFLVLTLDDGAYLRRFDDYELKLVPDSQRLGSLVSSPDAQSIVFFTVNDQIMGGGKLRRYSFATGTTVTIRDSATSLYPFAWQDRTVLAYSDRGNKVLRVPIDGGEPTTLVELDRGHLHGGGAVALTPWVLLDVHDEVQHGIDAVNLETGERRRVLDHATNGVVTGTGHLLFLRDGALIGAPFDRAALAVAGAQVPLAAGVRRFSVAEDGTLAYLPESGHGRAMRLVHIAPDGATRVLSEGEYGHTRYAPNGRFVSATTGESINVIDVESGSVRPLAREGYRMADHVWRPDSRAIVVATHSEDKNGLYELTLDGSTSRALLEVARAEAEVYPTGYAPDGSGLIFARYMDDDSNLWWLPADGSEPRPLLATKASEDLGRFSPDGTWVAYESNETGRQEVWLAAYDRSGARLGAKWQVSMDGGKDPLFSADGRRLYFENLDDRLIEVPLRVSANDPGSLVFGERKEALDLRKLDADAKGDESYDVAPSGDGFVFVQDASGRATEVRIVLNWLDELRRLVPAP